MMKKSVILTALFLSVLPVALAAAAEATEDAALRDRSRSYRTKAERGDVAAMRELGRCYAEGKGVSQLADEAKYWYTRAAKANDAEAKYRLAMMELEALETAGTVSPQVLDWLHEAEQAGYAPAADTLGCLYMAGRGVEKDKKTALAFFRQAAEAGCASSQFRIGMCHLLGKELAKDRAVAAEWFRKAAEQGHIESTAMLGSMLLVGEGVKKNEADGLKYLRIAAERGSAMALRNLGITCLRARGGAENTDEALTCLRRAAAMGDAMSMYYLGQCYAEGKAVEQDPRLAGVLFRKAIDKGLPQATAALNRLPEECRARISEPLEQTRADAEWGHPAAQYQLSRYYRLRLDGDSAENALEADFWLRRAAGSGHPAAKEELAGKAAE